MKNHKKRKKKQNKKEENVFLKRSLLLPILIGLMLLPGCKKGEKEGKVVARVGKSTLTVKELINLVSPQILIQTNRETRESILDNWVTNEVVYREALKKGFGEKPKVKEQIEELKKRIVTQVYVQEVLSSAAFVTDPEGRDYFNNHRDEYNTIIEASHISSNSVEEANEILSKLKGGTSFSSLARKYSTDSSTASKGGYLGSFRRGDLAKLPFFEKNAFTLRKPGEITNVVQTEFGFDIIKLHSRKKSKEEVEYKDVSESIMQILRQEKFRVKTESLIDSLKAIYKTEIYPEVLEKELGLATPSGTILPPAKSGE